jgi:hypothetical protein
VQIARDHAPVNWVLEVVAHLSVSCRFTALLVDHHLAQNGAKQPAESVGHAPRFDVHVTSSDWLLALDVETRLEQGVVEARDEAAHRRRRRRLVERIAARRVVGVDGQFFQVVHVVLVGRHGLRPAGIDPNVSGARRSVPNRLSICGRIDRRQVI